MCHAKSIHDTLELNQSEFETKTTAIHKDLSIYLSTYLSIYQDLKLLNSQIHHPPQNFPYPSRCPHLTEGGHRNFGDQRKDHSF